MDNTEYFQQSTLEPMLKEDNGTIKMQARFNCTFGTPNCEPFFDLNTGIEHCQCQLNRENSFLHKLLTCSLFCSKKFLVSREQLNAIGRRVYDDTQKIYLAKKAFEKKTQVPLSLELKKILKECQTNQKSLNKITVKRTTEEDRQTTERTKDRLFKESVEATNNFQDTDINGLFIVTENNKLMQKQNQKFSSGFEQSPQSIGLIITQSKQFKAKVDKLKSLIEERIKQVEQQNYLNHLNYDYSKYPFEK